MELCNGHILNKAIKKASRATVVLGKEIDNYFGQTVEPELVEFLNNPFLSKDELFQKSHDVRITIPGGTPIGVFYASAKDVQGKYPQINLTDSEGAIISSPFVKTEDSKLAPFKKALVEGSRRFNNFAILVSLIKSAYLALFRALGYEWVFCPGGTKVRSALASFYRDRPPIEHAMRYFGQFENAFAFAPSIQDLYGDTLTNGTVLLHYSAGQLWRQSLFGIACLFTVFNRKIFVFLPYFQTFGFDFASYNTYQAFLKDHSLTHYAYYAQIRNGKPERVSGPFRIRNVKSTAQTLR